MRSSTGAIAARRLRFATTTGRHTIGVIERPSLKGIYLPRCTAVHRGAQLLHLTLDAANGVLAKWLCRIAPAAQIGSRAFLFLQPSSDPWSAPMFRFSEYVSLCCPSNSCGGPVQNEANLLAKTK